MAGGQLRARPPHCGKGLGAQVGLGVALVGRRRPGEPPRVPRHMEQERATSAPHVSH